MRLAVVKLDKHETVFYNINIFNEEENLLVFPYEQFLKDYDEAKFNVKIMKNSLKRLLEDTTDNPKREYDILEVYHEKIQRFIDSLLTFDTQTTLESFNKKKEVEKRTAIPIPKGDLQCLIGLNGGR